MRTISSCAATRPLSASANPENPPSATIVGFYFTRADRPAEYMRLAFPGGDHASSTRGLTLAARITATACFAAYSGL
jgi:hypothetical protein